MKMLQNSHIINALKNRAEVLEGRLVRLEPIAGSEKVNSIILDVKADLTATQARIKEEEIYDQSPSK